MPTQGKTASFSRLFDLCACDVDRANTRAPTVRSLERFVRDTYRHTERGVPFVKWPTPTSIQSQYLFRKNGGSQRTETCRLGFETGTTMRARCTRSSTNRRSIEGRGRCAATCSIACPIFPFCRRMGGSRITTLTTKICLHQSKA